VISFYKEGEGEGEKEREEGEMTNLALGNS
jgi:hypothetical protein